jgi:hypothetical protein
MTKVLNMPLVPAPLSVGDTDLGFTGVAVFECLNARTRNVALSIVQENGSVVGVLLDDASFDLFCETLALIVQARAAEGRHGAAVAHLPSLDPVRVLQ